MESVATSFPLSLQHLLDAGAINYMPNPEATRSVADSDDPIRHAHVNIALHRINADRVSGGLAEVGVYRGTTSRVIHRAAPERKLYLFDTFDGFDKSDLEGENLGDMTDNFKDTSVEVVLGMLGDASNVEIRKGFFPETARGLESEKFAFVMLDVDLYRPTLEGLHFFYPRLSRGGFVFVHDCAVNDGNAFAGVGRAVHEFLADKPELLIEIPDRYGSGLFRKL